jgi:hypothetical protein
MNPVIPPASWVRERCADEELAMRHGYVEVGDMESPTPPRKPQIEVPITSRAAQAELERQQARRAAALNTAGEGAVAKSVESSPRDREKTSEPESPLDAPAPTDS